MIGRLPRRNEQGDGDERARHRQGSHRGAPERAQPEPEPGCRAGTAAHRPFGYLPPQTLLKRGIHRGGKRPNVIAQLAPRVGDRSLATSIQSSLELC
jgi:hypothetical protein